MKILLRCSPAMNDSKVLAFIAASSFKLAFLHFDIAFYWVWEYGEARYRAPPYPYINGYWKMLKFTPDIYVDCLLSLPLRGSAKKK